jgi:hypothetical protein
MVRLRPRASPPSRADAHLMYVIDIEHVIEHIRSQRVHLSVLDNALDNDTQLDNVLYNRCARVYLGARSVERGA